MSEKSHRPTAAELEILQILWENGPSSVRFVNDQLNVLRDVGYTSTLKTMQIMNEKGLVARDTKHRSHIYIPCLQEKEVKQRLLTRFVRTAFRGSAMDLVLHALGNETISEEELEKIKAYLDDIDENRQKK